MDINHESLEANKSQLKSVSIFVFNTVRSFPIYVSFLRITLALKSHENSSRHNSIKNMILQKPTIYCSTVLLISGSLKDESIFNMKQKKNA